MKTNHIIIKDRDLTLQDLIDYCQANKLNPTNLKIGINSRISQYEINSDDLDPDYSDFVQIMNLNIQSDCTILDLFPLYTPTKNKQK